MQYIIYARGSGDSGDRQVKTLRELAASTNDEIVEVVTEVRTAKYPNKRPKFGRVVKTSQGRNAA
jgi:predicted site-specific integrase-resolvase